MKESKWFLTKREFLTIGAFVIVTPLVLNYILFTWRAPWVYGDGNVWLGFWGNYSGGFVGALVAMWIANRQASEQRKVLKQQIEDQRTLDIEKEERVRAINQLPSLVKIQYELVGLEEQLWNVHADMQNKENTSKEETIRNQNARVFKGEYRYIETLKEKINNGTYKLTTKFMNDTYNMDNLKDEVYTYLEKIENVELHIQLIECLNFYRDFSLAVNYDLLKAQDEALDIIKSVTASEDKKKELMKQFMKLNKEKNLHHLNKQGGWKDFYEKGMLLQFRDVLANVKKEIEVVKEIQQKTK